MERIFIYKAALKINMAAKESKKALISRLWKTAGKGKYISLSELKKSLR